VSLSWFLKLPIITWLAPRAGKKNQILRCDWLPERATWSYLARSGLPAVSRMKKGHRISPLLTKLVRWRCISVSVYTHAKKELGQCAAILTSHLVNNHIYLPPSFVTAVELLLLVKWSVIYSMYSCFEKDCPTKPYATIREGIMGNGVHGPWLRY